MDLQSFAVGDIPTAPGNMDSKTIGMIAKAKFYAAWKPIPRT